MLPATVTRRVETIPDVSRSGKRINGLFRLMETPDLWMQAYQKIHTNTGATTPGVDGNTLDGFSDERVFNLIELLTTDRYRPKPVRRTYLPKGDGRFQCHHLLHAGTLPDMRPKDMQKQRAVFSETRTYGSGGG